MKKYNHSCFVFLFLTFFCANTEIFAQAHISWDEFVEQYFVDNDEGDDPDLKDQQFTELQEIHDHPFNINTVTDDQLRILPFLNDEQINAILEYVGKNHPVRSLGELMLIYALDQPTRSKLMLFLYAGEDSPTVKDTPTLGSLLKYSTHQFILRGDIPFYIKARDDEDIGDRYYRSLRYSLTSGKHLEAGVQIEKDAGEKDFDYISAFILLRKLGAIKVLTVGDYKLSFGQGLVVNTSMSFGKLLTLSQMQNMDKGISRHSSLSENNYFRGVATTIGITQNISFSPFISFRNQDATLTADSSAITSFKTDGLHRTPLEKSKKGNTGNFTFGGNIRWETLQGRMRLGFTAIHSHLSRALRPKCDTQSSLYRLYNPTGQDFTAYSLSYTFRERKISFSGESAMNENNAFATNATLQYKPNSFNSFTLIGRYYSAKYATLYGNSFGENSSPQNESGLFIGWNTTMFSHLQINTYFDYFYFPYLKYQISDRSRGYEALAQITWSPSSRNTFNLRYRIKFKQKDYGYTLDGTDYTQLAYYTNQSLRLQMANTLTSHLSSRLTLSATFNHKPSGQNDKGFLLSENIRWTGEKRHKIDLTLAYFNTDSYDSRVYAYESGLLYTFGMSSFSDHGIRATLSTYIPLNQTIWVRAKAGMTKYFNRSAIGTGLDQINADNKEDLSIQIGINIR